MRSTAVNDLCVYLAVGRVRPGLLFTHLDQLFGQHGTPFLIALRCQFLDLCLELLLLHLQLSSLPFDVPTRSSKLTVIFSLLICNEPCNYYRGIPGRQTVTHTDRIVVTHL